MAGRLWLLLAIATELGAVLVYGNDPTDLLSPQELADVGHLHHVAVIAILVAVSTASYILYVRANRRSRGPQEAQYAA